MKSKLLVLTIIAFLASLMPVQAQEFHVRQSANNERHIFTVIDSVGMVQYLVERERVYDTPVPSLHVFANRRLLVVDGYAGVVELYEVNGRMLFRSAFNNSVKPDHERIVEMDGTGYEVVLAVSGPDRAGVQIMRARADGSFHREGAIEASHVSGVRLSSSGAFTALGTYSWKGPEVIHTVHFLKHGSSVSTVDHDFKAGAFDEKENVFLVAGRTSMIVVDVNTGTVLSRMDYGGKAVIGDMIWTRGSFHVSVHRGLRFAHGAWEFTRLSVAMIAPGTEPQERPVSGFSSFIKSKLQSSQDAILVEVDGVIQSKFSIE